MSSRTQTWNAFETSLDSILNPGVLFVDFVSVANLSFPLYVTLAPENPAQLEYLKIINIVGSTVEFEARNLDGSAGDGTHAPGTIVRLTWTSQLQDDIFNDIEALEAEDVTLAAVDAAHAAASDPHVDYINDAELSTALADYLLEAVAAATYLPLAGGTLTGALVLDGPPGDDLEAATRLYVDSVAGGVGLPSGTRMIFDQDSAPVGWTRDTSTVDDKMIMIVTGTRGVDDGDWQQPNHSHGNVDTDSAGSHVHTTPTHVHQAPSHNHNIPSHAHTNPNTGVVIGGGTAVDNVGAGATFEYAVAGHSHTQTGTGTEGAHNSGAGGQSNTTSVSGGNTGSGPTHTHGMSDTQDAATVDTWRPLHRDMIIAVKD